jgi:hypothetical protein
MAAHPVHDALLELHKTLLEAERREHERHHGRLTPHQFLNALLHDPSLAWLRPLTTLLASFAEADSDEAHRQQLRNLLTPTESPNDFQQHYKAALHRSPELAYAHGALMRALH